MSHDLSQLLVNTIKGLSMDAIEAANSGHPGMPMGMADAASVLWTEFLHHNPKNPAWANRDRFVLSAGHGSMLLYSLMHLTGYEDIGLEQIKNFRQLGSKTPGHPETQITRGVETTTGPLGQGFANAVGMALAEAHLATRFNPPGYSLVDHFTFAIVGDGCLMEGISYEAASLAGHLGLGKLVVLYDDNEISIDGRTDITFTEDVSARFEAMGWQVISVDGHARNQVSEAIAAAKGEGDRPSLIRCKTQIGKGAPTKEDSSAAHGAPLGTQELEGAKASMNWPTEPFHVPQELRVWMGEMETRWAGEEEEWNTTFSRFQDAHPALAAEFMEATTGSGLPAEWEDALPTFPLGESMATRKSSGVVLNAIANTVKTLVGGSADLEGSNNTKLGSDVHMNTHDFAPRNIHFGVREHAMGAICNGMALHSGVIPFCGTFLQFSDYMRPAVRLAALMEQRIIYVWTHDSIFLGEDGPTHQPVEHISALRAIPNLHVIRPADANEVAGAWKLALNRTDGPTALALTRQGLKTQATTSADKVSLGAYVVREATGTPDAILMASGSEVQVALDAADTLAAEGTSVRVVSFPCWEAFDRQDAAYRESVLPSSTLVRVVVEAGRQQGWERYAGTFGAYVTIERFGESANANDLAREFGFTAENVSQKTREALVSFDAKKASLRAALS